MGNTVQPNGRRVFNDAISHPQDSQDLADDIYELGNARVGTSAERQAFPSGQTKNGMLWSESDTGLVYRTDGAGAWRLVGSAAGTAFASAAGRTYVSAVGGVTVMFPSGRFTSPPAVVALPYNAASVLVPLVTALTKDSFLLRVYTLGGAASTANVSWSAIQQRADGLNE